MNEVSPNADLYLLAIENALDEAGKAYKAATEVYPKRRDSA
jgi:hypothetical protein